MDEAVHDGHGQVVVVEELTPVGEVLVGGDDHQAILVEAVAVRLSAGRPNAGVDGHDHATQSAAKRPFMPPLHRGGAVKSLRRRAIRRIARRRKERGRRENSRALRYNPTLDD